MFIFNQEAFVGISSELQSLFCNKKLKDTEPVEVAESPKTQTVDRTVIDPGTGEPTTQTVDAPVIASEIAESPKTLTFDTPVITPDTPCDFPTSVGSETGPKVADTDDVGPASDYGKVASPIEDQELDLTLISEVNLWLFLFVLFYPCQIASCFSFFSPSFSMYIFFHRHKKTGCCFIIIMPCCRICIQMKNTTRSSVRTKP